jgi:outer membrane protein insertion porin family
MYTGTVQLTFPLGFPEEFGVAGRTFSDIGSSGKLSPTTSSVKDVSSMRMSAGFGLTWRSPFGPVGVDAAVPFIKEDFDITESIRFNFGTRF